MPKIDAMYAWVTEDTPGDEGVTAFLGVDGTWFPMVGADMERAESLREQAQNIANLTGKSLRLVEFTDRHEIDELRPE